MSQNRPSLKFLGTALLGGAIAALLLSYQWGHARRAALG
jgi:hypothetical protein